MNSSISSSNNDRIQVVSDSFRNDSLFAKEDVRGVGQARPNLEAVDFAPKRFSRVVIKVKQT